MKTVQKLVLAAMLAMAAMVALTMSTQGPTGPPPRSVVEDGTEQDAAMTAIDNLKFRERGRGRPGQAGGDRRVEGGGGGRRGPSLFSHNVSAAKPSAPGKEKAAPAVAVDLAEVKRRGLRGEHPHVICDTNEGRMVVEVRFDWSPIGAERFVALVDDGFFTNNVFYRVTPIKEMAIAQFGHQPDKALQKKWGSTIKDDPNTGVTLGTGYIQFAGGGHDTRSCHMFITRHDHTHLGQPTAVWETPVARVIDGIEVLGRITEVGDLPQWGSGPSPGSITSDPTFHTDFPGNYLRSKWPTITYWKACSLETPGSQ